MSGLRASASPWIPEAVFLTAMIPRHRDALRLRQFVLHIIVAPRSRHGMNAAVVQHMRIRFAGVPAFATPLVTVHLPLHSSVDWQEIQSGTMYKTLFAKAGVFAIPEEIPGYGISPYNLESLSLI